MLKSKDSRVLIQVPVLICCVPLDKLLAFSGFNPFTCDMCSLLYAP
jgi:hypothetical protein